MFSPTVLQSAPRFYQGANRGSSFASLPGDEYIPGGALIGDRVYGDIRYLQVPNEHRIQGDAVFVARDSKTFCDAFKSSHGSESWTKRAEATAKLTDFLIVAGGARLRDLEKAFVL